MLTIKVTPQAADLIIGALRQLPHSQVHDLVMDIFTQVKSQQIQAPADAEPVAEEVKAGGTD